MSSTSLPQPEQEQRQDLLLQTLDRLSLCCLAGVVKTFKANTGETPFVCENCSKECVTARTALLAWRNAYAAEKVREAKKAETLRVFEVTSKALHGTYSSILNGIADGLEPYGLTNTANKIRQIAHKARTDQLDDILAEAKQLQPDGREK